MDVPAAPPPAAKVKTRRRKRPRKPISTSLLKQSAQQSRTLTQDTKLTSKLLHTEAPGSLQPSHSHERTYNLPQSSFLPQTNATTQSKANFHLDLTRTNLHPYILTTYSRSGKTLLLASKRGHITTINWRSAHQNSENFLNEQINDATFLHNDLFHAVAQRKHTYIYDNTGIQLHVLRHTNNPISLSYLPHHFLLVSLSIDPRRISWTDTSTGQIVSDTVYSSRLRAATSLSPEPNSLTGVVSATHVNGTVSLWSPNSPKPLASMFTHEGGVRFVRNSPDGRLMVTAGVTSEVKIWDVRMFRCKGVLKMGGCVKAMDVSQRNMIAVGVGGGVFVHDRLDRLDIGGGSGVGGGDGGGLLLGSGWKLGGGRRKAGRLYMRERFGDRAVVSSVKFCPFEDLVSICLEDGVKSMVVPGSGEVVWDASGPHPYEGRKERREKEVRGLLDKLPPESISLEVGVVGGVEKDAKGRLMERKEEMRRLKEGKVVKMKKKSKGRNKIGKRLRRRQANVMDAKKAEMMEKLEQKKRDPKRRKEIQEAEQVEPALRRFVKR